MVSGANWVYGTCAIRLIVVNQRCLQHVGLAEEVEVVWAAWPQKVCLVYSWCKSVCVWSCLMRQNLFDICKIWKKSKFFFFPLIWTKFVCWKRGHAHINPDLLGPKFKVFNCPESACMGGERHFSIRPSCSHGKWRTVFAEASKKKYCAAYRCFSHTPVLLSSN